MSRPRTVAAVLAVAILLAGSRWASYAGVTPIFLADVLLAFAVIHHLIYMVTRARVAASARSSVHRMTPPTRLLLGLALVYIALRALLSTTFVGSLDWARDGAPYFYIGIAAVAAQSMGATSSHARRRTMRILWWALTFHLVWVAVVAVAPFLARAEPLLFFQAGVFQVRPDIDCAILGVTTGLLIRRFILGIKPHTAIGGLALCAIAASSFVTRAGFLSIALCVALSCWTTYRSLGRASGRKIILLTSAVAVTALVIVVGPSTTVGQRVAATLGVDNGSQVAADAQGTVNARRLTWERVVSYTNQSNTTRFFGNGMGLDFLQASGSSGFLEGTSYENVRSPHNFFVGTFARLGLLGLALIASIVVATLGRIFANSRTIAKSELVTAAGLIVIAIVPIASLGVVLEAPFGAVPFWWAVGIILTLPTRKKQNRHGVLQDSGGTLRN